MSAASVSSQARAATAAPAAASPQARSINLLCAPCGGREARVWVGPPGGGWVRSGVLRSSRGHPEKLGGRRREGEHAPERQEPRVAREASAELGTGGGASPRILGLRLLFRRLGRRPGDNKSRLAKVSRPKTPKGRDEPSRPSLGSDAPSVLHSASPTLANTRAIPLPQLPSPHQALTSSADPAPQPLTGKGRAESAQLLFCVAKVTTTPSLGRRASREGPHSLRHSHSPGTDQGSSSKPTWGGQLVAGSSFRPRVPELIPRRWPSSSFLSRTSWKSRASEDLRVARQDSGRQASEAPGKVLGGARGGALGGSSPGTAGPGPGRRPKASELKPEPRGR